MKKISIIMFLVLLFVGCSDSDLVEQLSEENNELKNRIEQLEVINQRENENLTINDMEIKSTSESPDKRFVVFIMGHNEFSTVYMLDMMKQKVKEINDSHISGIHWSPDSKYYIINSGTYVTRTGEMYASDTNELAKVFGFIGQLYWISDNEVIYVRENIDSDFQSGVELAGRTEIVKHNLENNEMDIIIDYEEDTNFRIKTVTNNIVEYTRRNYAEEIVEIIETKIN